MDLASMNCSPDQESRAPLTRREIGDLKTQVPDWTFHEGRLIRRFEKEDFAACIAFINEIAEITYNEGHFPEVCIRRNRYVDVSWYSHFAGGLTLDDFIMAAKIDAREFTKEGMSL